MNPIDVYIDQFDGVIKERLIEIRSCIKELIPDADETISYQMPAYKLHKKPIIYFAGYKNHIGVYPTPSGIEAFKEEINDFKWAKGSIQFPHSKPLPIPLIKKIILTRYKEVKTQL